LITLCRRRNEVTPSEGQARRTQLENTRERYRGRDGAYAPSFFFVTEATTHEYS
jgi:hypothetical protein